MSTKRKESNLSKVHSRVGCTIVKLSSVAARVDPVASRKLLHVGHDVGHDGDRDDDCDHGLDDDCDHGRDHGNDDGNDDDNHGS